MLNDRLPELLAIRMGALTYLCQDENASQPNEASQPELENQCV